MEAGIAFETIAPGVDEDLLVSPTNPGSAEELTRLLAQAKALAVASQFPGSLVLGCDSALEFEGQIL